MTASHDAIILGAGVIGLTIALELAQKGLKVVVVARDLPEDIHSTSFASPWAGASFAPWAETEAEVSREERTFHRLSALAQSRPDLVAVTKYRYGWNTPGAYKTPPSARYLPDYRSLEPHECPGPFSLGIGFTSLTINPPLYTLYLLDLLSELGVKIHRHRVSSIYEAFNISLPPPPSAAPGVPGAPAASRAPLASSLVINATGLGALSLLGVTDPLVHPAKGQTITVRAPLVTECLGWKEPRDLTTHPEMKGQQVYIIPRPGSGGLVTVGGCYLPGDWSTNPDPQVAERILKEALELCPELAHKAEAQGEGEEEEGRVEVVSHNVGLRPCRKGGIRIELEEMDLGDMVEQGGAILPVCAAQSLESEHGKAIMGKVAVVHAYGIGGAGYQDSFGVAEDVAAIVMEHLGERRV